MTADKTSPPEDGRSARAELRRKKRKAQMIEVATQVIAERGYANTSVSDVIKAAGVSRGTFYLYFESRDALFDEIIGAFVARLAATVNVIDADAANPLALLRENFRRVISLLASNRDLTKVLFREAVGLSAEVDARLNAFYDYLRRMVAGALEKGVMRQLTRQVDDVIVASAIVGMVREVIYSTIVVGDGEVDPDRITSAIIDFGMNGLRAV